MLGSLPAPRSVAVVVPCHNEAAAISAVVEGFRKALPYAHVVVADNASTDETAPLAEDAGATVITESRPGKGYAMRRLFADVEADCYVMVDGDGTYDPSTADVMIRLVLEGGMDMVNATRVPASAGGEIYRRGHTLGNAVLTWIFRTLFKLRLDDTLSGYRALSRRFVKTFPSGATGFEIEAELNAHAATLGVPIAEVPSPYYARTEGSESKLNTYRDGVRILRRNLRLFRDASPGLAFLILSLPWLSAAVPLMWIPFAEYLETGQVSRFPSLIAGVAFLTLGALLIIAGTILERVARNRVEAIRLSYLAHPSPVVLLRPPLPLQSDQTHSQLRDRA